MKKLLYGVLALCLAVNGDASAAELESGLKVGEFPPAFNVKDVTGPKAGKSLCYRCAYGNRPVVTIFTRTMDDKVAQLVKQVDDVVGKNQENKMAAFVVLLTDDPDAAEGKLAEVAKKNKIQHIPLTVFDGVAGPPSYKVSEGADLTVMMWVESNVKVNHALEKGKLNEKQIEAIVADATKILE